MNLNSSSKPNSPLTRQAMQGGMWLFALRLSGLTLGFTKLVILAHLLTAHDYGFMSFCHKGSCRYNRNSVFLLIIIMGICFITYWQEGLFQGREIETEHSVDDLQLQAECSARSLL